MFKIFFMAPDGGAAGGGTSSDAGSAKTEAATVYGKQEEAAAEVPEGSGQPEAGAESKVSEEGKPDKKANWKALIEGEYKEEFQNQTQGIINKRFREMKTLQEQNGQLSKLAEKLADRYGVSAGDTEGLLKAIDADSGFLREQADRAGMTVEQYREQQSLRRENAHYRQQQEALERERGIQEQVNKWHQEAEQVKEIYPDFDLEKEFRESKDFTDLIKSGIPVQKAYEVAHFDQLVGGALQYATKKAAEATANNIRNRAERPEEGASKGGPAVTVKSDVHKLTRKDREEIARRVAAGEHITFG